MFGNEWKSLLLFFFRFFSFFVVWKMYGKHKEIYGKPMEVCAHAWKCMEKLKFVESYGNVWKIYGNLMKNYGNVWKCIELYRKSMDMH